MISNRRYNDLNDKYRKLENEYIYLQRWYKAQSKQYKEQEKILSRIEQINDLYKEKIQKFETERDSSKQKINKTERINDILIKRILNYQKILEEKYSDWRVVADNAWRYSNGIMISYEIPDPFLKGYAISYNLEITNLPDVSIYPNLLFDETTANPSLKPLIQPY